MNTHRRIWFLGTLGVCGMLASCGPAEEDAPGASAQRDGGLTGTERGSEPGEGVRGVEARDAEHEGREAVEAEGSDGDDGAPSNDASIRLPALTLTPGDAWRVVEPSSSMRLAEAELPDEEGGEGGTLVVYYFGEAGAGTHEANLARWASQFVLPDGTDPADAATVEKIEREGYDIIVMRLSGTYIAETSPGSGERLNKPEWGLVGVIVETSRGPYYLKLTGPTAVLDAHRAEIEAMIASLEPA